jgi:hypothetical protein
MTPCNVHDPALWIVDNHHTVPEEIAPDYPPIGAEYQAEHHLKHGRQDSRSDSEATATDFGAHAPNVGLELTESRIEILSLSHRRKPMNHFGRNIG